MDYHYSKEPGLYKSHNLVALIQNSANLSNEKTFVSCFPIDNKKADDFFIVRLIFRSKICLVTSMTTHDLFNSLTTF